MVWEVEKYYFTINFNKINLFYSDKSKTRQKRKRNKEQEEQKTQQDGRFKSRYICNCIKYKWIKRDIPVKGWKKKYHTNTKIAGEAVLITHKVRFSIRSVTRDKERMFYNGNWVNPPGRYNNSKFVCPQ